MQSILNFLRGFADIRIEGAFPERFINICARNGVAFWNLRRLDGGSFRVMVRAGDVKRLTALAERSMCTATEESRRGAPVFALRFVTRYIFVGGMAAAILFVVLMSQRVWDFEVSGNEILSDEVILRHLSDLGVKPGTKLSDIDADLLQTQMLLRLPELRWFTVNGDGSIALVEVRERVMKPEMVDEAQPANVVAKKSGIIEKIAVLEGSAQVAVGDIVEEGQLIASGIVDTAAGVRVVHAMADVTAKTWYTLTAAAPLGVGQKTQAEAEKVKRAIIFAGNRINLYFDSSICLTECDKITERTRLTLPGGLKLPVEWEKSTYTVFAGGTYEQDGEDMESYLIEQLLARLELDSGGAEVIDTEFDFEERGGMLYATLTATCREEISLGVPLKFDLTILDR